MPTVEVSKSYCCFGIEDIYRLSVQAPLNRRLLHFCIDMIPKRKFSDLLRIVGSIPGLERLRFVTSHPRYMSMSVVEEILNTPSVCESIHIPFQSGSNAILASMGRGHTREKYLHIVDRIRSVRLL